MPNFLIYRYKFRALPLLWGGGLGLLLLIMAVIFFVRYPWWQATWFFMVAIAFIAAIGWLLIRQTADVVVSEVGLERRSFGFIWQRIKWHDMCRLTILWAVNPENGEKVSAYIFRSRLDKFFTLDRTISFQERPGEMRALIDKILENIKESDIIVVDKRGGKS